VISDLDIWHDALWFNLALSRSSLKVKVIGQSSNSRVTDKRSFLNYGFIDAFLIVYRVFLRYSDRCDLHL